MNVFSELLSTLTYLRTAKTLRPHFDREFYLQRNPDVACSGMDPLGHYIKFGARERRDPNPNFSTSSYLDKNEDVAASGVNPLLHFVLFGKVEGRTSNNSRSLARQVLASAQPPQI